ncbi:unnamed protein product [Oppiella nova]|uniref:Protein kinase domain-containing protein n=1 Tax=Oppiella nova TaxID=334625 RepID=A0A7R9LCJ6_9ACAR|nr:unnamed protein product [Oppiella nova]CAG2161402.1 unnamed protein product [Oppiella nova]
MSAIGSGGFGTVFKVKHKLKDHIYAVKCLQIYKEAKKLSKLSPDFVVQYYNSWNESKHLYIQMEFCSQNLQNILEVKPEVFGRHLGESMDCVEDLKPENILIAENIRNGRFVKLCDFGLAVEHMTASQSHSKNKGTPKYMAPELYRSKYTIKADIYSLERVSWINTKQVHFT